MEPTIESIRSSLDAFVEKMQRIAERYSPDERKDILVKLISQLSECVKSHAELMISERDRRFFITETDYHDILEDYLVVFRQIRKLPRAHPKSIYEISLISDVDTILKSHCEGQNAE